MKRVRDDLRPFKQRAALLLLASVALLFVLALRLAQLQLVDGESYRRAAENNLERELPSEALRGRLYDRHGRLLADNEVTFRLLLFPDEAKRLEETLLFLATEKLGRVEELRQRARQKRSQPSAPVLLIERLDRRQVLRLRARATDFPELEVIEGFRRTYPAAALTAHAVGYTRQASQDDIDRGAATTALVGASGIEALLEDELSGKNGRRLVVVDARGRQLGEREVTEPIAGRDLSLTLDLELQAAAAAAMLGHEGAVVALEPATGAVRILFSAPSFDPNVFATGLSEEIWATIRDDALNPLSNRAIAGHYPPGSTLKPFLALAALELGLDPGHLQVCRGSYEFGDHTYHCWARGGHGRVDMQRSIEASCDVWYYALSQILGIERIAATYRRFGLDRLTGLGLAGERPGLVGDPAWSKRVRGQPWYSGVTLSVAIGQGPVEATPLQLAQAFASLANGGLLVQPTLIEGRLGKTTALGIDPDYLDIVRSGLRKVIAGTHGTARRMRPLPIYGKTGTAQVARLQNKLQSELPRHLRHHAWFVGFLDEPSMVVAVLVEHGGGGGEVAAPVAKKVFEAILASAQPRLPSDSADPSLVAGGVSQ